MTLRTNSATRRRVVSRSSVVLTTSATSSSRGSTWVGVISWAGLELTDFILAAALPAALRSREWLGEVRNAIHWRRRSGILDYANIGQVSIAFGIVQSISDDVSVRDGKPDIVRLDRLLAPRRLVEQCSNA